MNKQASDAITDMLNLFPQTAQDYQSFLATLAKLCAGLTDQAVIEAADRFGAGLVPEQSMKFAPSGPEFVAEATRRQEIIDLYAKPRLPAPPAYRPGPLAPYQVTANRLRAENAHLPVLFEDVSYERWRQLSASKQIPVGAKWVAGLATVYGPEPKAEQAAA